MSRLYERMRVPCVRMVRRSVPDGEGGWAETWAEGRAFAATVVRDTSAEARIAEAAGVANSYVSVNLFFASFANQTRRSHKGGFTGCANVFSPIPVTP